MIATLVLPILAAASSPAGEAMSQRTECLQLAAHDPSAGEDAASEWFERAKGSDADQAAAQECLGTALANRGEWADAESAFLKARALAPEEAVTMRARLGAMAGNAALADERVADALASLDKAALDAGSAGDAALAGGIAIDRARAMVSSGDMAGAAAALAEARGHNPADWEAWLFSATLARRQGNLVAAQQFIETAVDLRPVELTVGLEAGVIAALSGHDAAARKSWQSVIDAKPKSREAEAARAYLMQLDQP